MDFATLGIRVDSRETVRARDNLGRFTRAADQAERSTDRLQSTSARAGRSLLGLSTSTARMAGALVGAVASYASLSGAIRTISTFGRSMSQVQAITRATDAEMVNLRSTAQELGATTEFSAAQAADGLRFLGMAGFSASESMAAIPAVLDLATASGMGLAESADIVSNAASGFGLAANQAGSVADILAAASSRANTSVSQLGTAMAYSGPVANALGISMGDTAAVIGVMSDAGVQGSRAGTALRAALASLVNPSENAATTLRQMGLRLDQVNPQSVEFTEIIETLAEAGLDAGQAMQIFGQEAGPAMLAVVGQSGRLSELAGELRNVSGEAKRMGTTIRDDLLGDAQGLGSAAQSLALALGESGLTQAMRFVVQAATSAVRGLAGLVTAFAENETAVRAAGVVLVALASTQIPAAITAIGTLVTGLTSAGTVVATLSTGLGILRGVLIGLGGPVGILFALLGGAATLLLTYERNSGTAQTAIDEMRTAQGHLNEALGNFQTGAAGAGSEAIAYAQNLETAARAAIAAAEAQLAFREAQLAGITDEALEVMQAQPGWESNPLRGTYESAAQARAEIAESTLALDGARRTLNMLRIEAATASRGFNQLAFDTEAVTDAAQTVADAIDSATDPALEDLDISLGGASGAAQQLGDGLTDAERAAAKLADEFNRHTLSAIGRVSNAWGEFVASGFSTFKEFTRSVFQAFKQLLVNMIATAARNRIVFSLGLGGVAAGPAAAARNGALGQLGGEDGLLGGLLGSFGSKGSIFGLGGLAGGSGFLGGLGNALSHGIGGLFNIGANSAGLGLAGSLGAAVPLIGGLALAFSFFRKKTKLLDSGIRATVTEMDAVIESFRKIQTKRFLGLSKKTRNHYSALSSEQAAPFEQAIAEMQGGVLAASGALGFSDRIFRGFSHQVSVSTKGLSEEEASRKVQEALLGISDAMAEMVFAAEHGVIEAAASSQDAIYAALAGGGPETQQALGARAMTEAYKVYAKAGEGASATLQRLANSLVTVNDVFDQLGFGLQGISLAGGAAASAIVDLYGSLEDFQKYTGSYYQNFYTEAERHAKATERMGAALAKLGIHVIPATRQAFRALVEQAEAAGNDALVASLIKLSPAFAEIKNQANALSDSLNQSDLFKTRADQLYASSSAGYTTSIERLEQRQGGEVVRMLREIVRAVREGDINNSRINSRLLAVQERQSLEAPS